MANARGGAIGRKPIRKEAVLGIVFVSIPLLGFLIFRGFPLLISFIIQFGDMDHYDVYSLTWNNFANFVTVFTDDRFWKSLGITFWVTCAQFVGLVTALLLALTVNRDTHWSKILEVIYFIPYICSSVAVAIIWMRMFNGDNGIINSMLVHVLGEGARVNWFNDVNAYTWMLFIVSVWHIPGYGMVMYKASLRAIDPSLYEAAEIDGATTFQKFYSITLPGVAQTSFYLLITGIIAGMRSFDIPKIFAGNSWTGNAGPHDMGLTSFLYIYNQATVFDNMPVSAVMSWVMFVIIFFVSLANIIIRKKRVDE